MPLFGLGVLILWLGWFGFNPGSTLGALDGRFTEVLVVTQLAAARRRPRRDRHELLRRRRRSTSAWPATARSARSSRSRPLGLRRAVGRRSSIGLIAGVIVPLGVYAIDKKIDDPVGALTAHGLCGVWGTLACGLFTAAGAGRVQRRRRRRRPVLHGLLHAARRPGARRRHRVRVRVRRELRHLLGHQEDLRAARHRGGGGGRPRHLRARHVRLPGAVHPGAGARRLRCGPSADRCRSGAGAHRDPEGGART